MHAANQESGGAAMTQAIERWVSTARGNNGYTEGFSPVQDPVTMVSELTGKGIEASDAYRMVMRYYELLPAGGADAQAEVAPSESKPISARLQRWHAKISVLPYNPGQCYLHPVRWGRRADYLDKLGVNPSISQVLGKLRKGDLCMRAATHFRVFKSNVTTINPRYHIAEVMPGARDFGSVRDVFGSLLHWYPFVNLDIPPFEFELLSEVMPLSGSLGWDESDEEALQLVPPSSEMVALAASDTTVCRCRLHAVPHTVAGFASVGCSSKPAGKAQVLSRAYNRVSNMCVADESTRVQDKKALLLAMSDVTPKFLVGDQRSSDVSALCTSSVTTTIEAFGSGYCYLNLFLHDAWWRMARLLGPNPYLRDVARLHLWFGKPEMKVQKFILVKEGYFHVCPDKQQKGVQPDAGLIHHQRMRSLLAVSPAARVGYSGLASGLYGSYLSEAVLTATLTRTVRGVSDVHFTNERVRLQLLSTLQPDNSSVVLGAVKRCASADLLACGYETVQHYSDSVLVLVAGEVLLRTSAVTLDANRAVGSFVVLCLPSMVSFGYCVYGSGSVNVLHVSKFAYHAYAHSIFSFVPSRHLRVRLPWYIGALYDAESGDYTSGHADRDINVRADGKRGVVLDIRYGCVVIGGVLELASGVVNCVLPRGGAGFPLKLLSKSEVSVASV